MPNFTKLIAKLTAGATIAATFVAPMTASAAEFGPSSATVDQWVVSTLAHDAGSNRIEAFKVDKNLVAWTELNGSLRTLFAYDGVRIRTLASFAKSDWQDDGNGFYDAVSGNFDVADGVVVWTMSDGSDREIYTFDGDSVKRVSNNTYDDRHPIASAGRIAWTSQPSSQYNLMLVDRFGMRLIDSWMVPNYAFSGTNLFWLNKRANENWFRVFVNTGLVNSAVGEADDRVIADYFFTDGEGSAAWEYSTKQWSYDKRKVYLSYGGAQALMLLQRDVPPMVTRVEDMHNGVVMMNVTDLLLTDLQHKATMLRITGTISDGVFRKEVASKVRMLDNGYVRMREPGANNALVYRSDSGFEDVVSFDPIFMDRFVADGSAAAGARMAGGIVTYVEGVDGQPGKGIVIPSAVEATKIAVKNGDIAWIEGTPGNQTLKAATRTVLVKTAFGAKAQSGHLVKGTSGSTVYFAAADGKRYSFTGQGQYFSWFADFNGVQTVSNSTLAAMPLGGTVLYRPSSKLLKVAGDSRIYAIDKTGTLHWISSEEVAMQQIGMDWKNRIEIVDATVLNDYWIGSPVTQVFTYVSLMR